MTNLSIVTPDISEWMNTAEMHPETQSSDIAEESLEFCLLSPQCISTLEHWLGPDGEQASASMPNHPANSAAIRRRKTARRIGVKA
ncbi:MAG: hypothetical protein WD715_07085 [Dongiaceae bacterium]